MGLREGYINTYRLLYGIYRAVGYQKGESHLVMVFKRALNHQTCNSMNQRGLSYRDCNHP